MKSFTFTMYPFQTPKPSGHQRFLEGAMTWLRTEAEYYSFEIEGMKFSSSLRIREIIPLNIGLFLGHFNKETFDTCFLGSTMRRGILPPS